MKRAAATATAARGGGLKAAPKSARRVNSRTHIKQALTVSIVTATFVHYAYRNPRHGDARCSGCCDEVREVVMAARAIWKGELKLGTTKVPVKLYSAVQDRTVRFHMLDDRAKKRVKQHMIDPDSGDEVPTEEIQKGYEIEPGRYVILTEEDLEKLAATAFARYRDRRVCSANEDQRAVVRPALLPRPRRRRERLFRTRRSAARTKRAKASRIG